MSTLFTTKRSKGDLNEATTARSAATGKFVDNSQFRTVTLGNGDTIRIMRKDALERALAHVGRKS